MDDCGTFMSKTVLLIISVIFWAAGAALAYVGAYIINSYKNFNDFSVDQYVIVPTAIVIGVATIMFIIGIIGCCATLRESKIGLYFFFVIMFLIFAAEITAFVFSFIYKEKINGSLEKSMTDIFNKYSDDHSETRAVDYLQSQLKCCGVQNYTYWTGTPWFGLHNYVPHSCCKANDSCAGLLSQPELLNVQGCEGILEKLLQDVLNHAALLILGFSSIKLFGMLGVCVITCRCSGNGYQRL